MANGMPIGAADGLARHGGTLSEAERQAVREPIYQRDARDIPKGDAWADSRFQLDSVLRFNNKS